MSLRGLVVDWRTKPPGKEILEEGGGAWKVERWTLTPGALKEIGKGSAVGFHTPSILITFGGTLCVERSYLEMTDHTYVLRVFSRMLEKKTWGMQRTNPWPLFYFWFAVGYLWFAVGISKCWGSKEELLYWEHMCVRLQEKEEITLHYLSAPAFPLPRTHLSFLVLFRASVGHKRSRNISTFLSLWEESAALLVLT